MTTKDAPPPSSRDSEARPASNATLPGLGEMMKPLPPPELYAGEPTVIVPPDELQELASEAAVLDTPTAGERLQTLRTRPARRRNWLREILIGSAVVALCLGSFAIGFRLLNLTMGPAPDIESAVPPLTRRAMASEAAQNNNAETAAEIGTALLPGPDSPAPALEAAPDPAASVAVSDSADAIVTEPAQPAHGSTTPPASTAGRAPGPALRAARASVAQLRALSSLKSGTTAGTAPKPSRDSVLDTPLRPPAD